MAAVAYAQSNDEPTSSQDARRPPSERQVGEPWRAETFKFSTDPEPVRLRLRPPRSKTIVVGKLQRAIGHQGEFSLGPAVCQTDRRRPLRQGPIGIPSGWPLRKWLVRQRVC